MSWPHLTIGLLYFFVFCCFFNTIIHNNIAIKEILSLLFSYIPRYHTIHMEWSAIYSKYIPTLSSRSKFIYWNTWTFCFPSLVSGRSFFFFKKKNAHCGWSMYLDSVEVRRESLPVFLISTLRMCRWAGMFIVLMLRLQQKINLFVPLGLSCRVSSLPMPLRTPDLACTPQGHQPTTDAGTPNPMPREISMTLDRFFKPKILSNGYRKSILRNMEAT